MNKSGFQAKNILFSIRQILRADFERVSIFCALARLTKVQNVCFRQITEFTFSYAIQEKFTKKFIKFHAKNQYRANREAMSATSVFSSDI